MRSITTINCCWKNDVRIPSNTHKPDSEQAIGSPLTCRTVCRLYQRERGKEEEKTDYLSQSRQLTLRLPIYPYRLPMSMYRQSGLIHPSFYVQLKPNRNQRGFLTVMRSGPHGTGHAKISVSLQRAVSWSSPSVCRNIKRNGTQPIT